MNRLSRVTDPLGTTWSNAYDRMGNVVSHTPSYSAADTFTHDALGRVTQMTSPAGSFNCTYNAANLVTWQAFDDGRTNYYAYDAAYRMTSAVSYQYSSTPLLQYSYLYDSLGNTTQVTCNLSPVTCTLGSAYDAANQRTSNLK